MSYSSLMVHLDMRTKSPVLMDLVVDLADRFASSILGVAACQQLPEPLDCSSYATGLVDQDRTEAAKQLSERRDEFFAALPGNVRQSGWRSSICVSPSDYVASEACAADLIITYAGADTPLLETSPGLDLGDLVLRAGRPVLVVPRAGCSFTFESVIVASKDTGESRRAVRDALPFLKRARRVTVVEVAAETDLDDVRNRLSDVVGWLERHGVSADPLALASSGDVAETLDIAARDVGASLLVAGAYGHSRLREWVLGGFTHDILLDPRRCSLMSH